MIPNWVHKYPTEPGVYWFVGERYGRTKEVELILVHVAKCANGLLVMGDGQIIDKAELGEDWYFVKAELPEIPLFDKDVKFIGVLGNG